MNDWHIPDRLVRRFAGAAHELDDTTAASIEQHLSVCTRCQAAFAELPPRQEMDAIWAEVEDRLDRSTGGLTERLLRRMGLEAGPARLVAATPALRMGALLATAAVVAAVVLMSRAADGGAAFLALAPVIPAVLVALSFAPGADPAGECGLATPVFGFGLVIRRALGVELMALLVLAVGSMFVPIDGLRSLGWLLPALVLSLGTMAASVRWTAPVAAAALTAGWWGALSVVNSVERGADLAGSVVFGPGGQLALGCLAVVVLAAVAVNRQVLFQEVTR